MLSKILTTFLLLALVFASFPINKVQAETLNFSESTYVALPSSSFDVILGLGDATDVSTAHFIVTFDPAVISYTGVIASAYYSTGDPGCFIMPMTTENPAGTLDITLSRFGCGAGVNGGGDLATLSFTASSSEGTTDLEFSDFDVCHTDFSCEDYAWGSSAAITVGTPDTTAPVVTISGDNPQELEVLSAYTELGATASDNVDGDISSDIVISTSLLNMAVLGSYSVTYNVSDLAGNAALTATRTVNVVDTTLPVITLIGDNPFEVVLNNSYFEPGASANDNYDSDISTDIIISTSSLDVTATGTYNVTYNVSDSSSNAAIEAVRVVNVVEVASDISAPVRANGLPSGEQHSGTTHKTMSLTTDEDATCRYSASAGTAYADMAGIFTTTGSTTHEVDVTGLSSGNTYNYYVRCTDILNNENNDDYLISFSVAASAPSGGGGGGGSLPPPSSADDEEEYKEEVAESSGERTEGKIVLSWKNPSDSKYEKTIVIRTTEPISSFITFDALSVLGDIVYEGTAEEYIDTDIVENLAYYYALFTKNKDGDYSQATVTQKGVLAGPDENQGEIKLPSSGSGHESLAGLESSEVEIISLAEAEIVYEYNNFVELNDTTNKLYNFIVSKSPHELSEQDKYAIAYFVHEGTETTIILGAGERTGVLNSYLSVFAKLPQSDIEWQDVIKIGNGRWPTERNEGAEKKAEEKFFVTVYKRAPDMEYAHDNAAVTVITYGLRPRLRNLDSERTAIKTFKHIFGYNPESAIDWDITRAIAYSGAIR